MATITFSEKLEALRQEVIQGYKDFFRHDAAINDLRIKDIVASTQNENIEILGVLKTKKEISLIGVSEDSGDEFYEPIDKCNIEDLIHVLACLHKKRYNFR